MEARDITDYKVRLMQENIERIGVINMSATLQDATVFDPESVERADILLADEPTGNLDPNNSWEIMKLLEEINESGTTVVVVTHNREIVNAMQKRVITMKKGVIISDEEKGGYIDED